MLRDISIRARLLIAFSIMIVLLLGLGGVAVYSMNMVRVNAAVVENNSLPSVQNLGRLNSNLMRVRIYTLRLINETDENSKKEILKSLDGIKSDVLASRSSYEKLIGNDGERRLFEEFKNNEETYYQLQSDVSSYSLQGDSAAVVELIPKMNQSADKMVRILQELVGVNQSIAREHANKSLS